MGQNKQNNTPNEIRTVFVERETVDLLKSSFDKERFNGRGDNHAVVIFDPLLTGDAFKEIERNRNPGAIFVETGLHSVPIDKNSKFIIENKKTKNFGLILKILEKKKA